MKFTQILIAVCAITLAAATVSFAQDSTDKKMEKKKKKGDKKTDETK